jgi:hypothetical protein
MGEREYKKIFVKGRLGLEEMPMKNLRRFRSGTKGTTV